jgi:hypothetical protein
MRSTWCAALAAAAVALVAPAVAQANEVTHWNRIAMSTLVAFPPAAGGAAPALQIDMAMTQGAVYDAVNSIEKKKQRHEPYLLKKHFSSKASEEAAAATAAYRVLWSIVSGVPATIPFPNRGSLLLALDAEYTASLAAVPDKKSKEKGVDAGEAAAAAMIAARQGDGRFGPSQWKMQVGLGYWQPLLNSDGTPQLDPTPWVGGVRPFLLKSSSQFRTAGPNSLSSATWMADLNEVKAIGSVDSAVRSSTQTHNALFWQSNGGPALLWNDVADDLIEGRSIDMGDSARLLGMMNLAAADAAINTWNDKYFWDFWRPWNAIRMTEPTWTPLLAAPYPEHPSGHLGLDTPALRVLQMFFGNNVSFGVTSSRFGGETRFFNHFSEPLDEIIEARIWAGLHFRTGDVQAVTLGENVFRYMVKHYFQPKHGHGHGHH